MEEVMELNNSVTNYCNESSSSDENIVKPVSGENGNGPKRGIEKNTSLKRTSRVKTQLKLDSNRLCSPRGLSDMILSFHDVLFKGKGNEKSDLDVILKRLEHWAHRLCPRMPLDDCIGCIEKLGNNRSVQVYLKNLRMDVEISLLDDKPVTSLLNDYQLSSDIKAVGSSAYTSRDVVLSEEQKKRIAESKLLALEKRRSNLVLGAGLHSSNACNPDDVFFRHTSDISSQKVAESRVNLEDENEVVDIDSLL